MQCSKTVVPKLGVTPHWRSTRGFQGSATAREKFFLKVKISLNALFYPLNCLFPKHRLVFLVETLKKENYSISTFIAVVRSTIQHLHFNILFRLSRCFSQYPFRQENAVV
jgi:hypothetical protein